MSPDRQCELELQFLRAVSRLKRLQQKGQMSPTVLVSLLLSDCKDTIEPNVPDLVELALLGLAEGMLERQSNQEAESEGHLIHSLYYGLPNLILRRDGSLLELGSLTLLDAKKWVEDHPNIIGVSSCLEFMIEDLSSVSATGSETLEELAIAKTQRQLH